MHWAASSCLGLLLTGCYKPFCAVVYETRDCAARRAFLRAMDRVFEPDHCRIIWATWAVGNAIR